MLIFSFSFRFDTEILEDGIVFQNIKPKHHNSKTEMLHLTDSLVWLLDLVCLRQDKIRSAKNLYNIVVDDKKKLRNSCSEGRHNTTWQLWTTIFVRRFGSYPLRGTETLFWWKIFWKIRKESWWGRLEKRDFEKRPRDIEEHVIGTMVRPSTLSGVNLMILKSHHETEEW